MYSCYGYTLIAFNNHIASYLCRKIDTIHYIANYHAGELNGLLCGKHKNIVRALDIQVHLAIASYIYEHIAITNGSKSNSYRLPRPSASIACSGNIIAINSPILPQGSLKLSHNCNTCTTKEGCFYSGCCHMWHLHSHLERPKTFGDDFLVYGWMREPCTNLRGIAIRCEYLFPVQRLLYNGPVVIPESTVSVTIFLYSYSRTCSTGGIALYGNIVFSSAYVHDHNQFTTLLDSTSFCYSGGR